MFGTQETKHTASGKLATQQDIVDPDGVIAYSGTTLRKSGLAAPDWS